MDFLNGNIKSIYFKYLAAAFGSAMITSVYSIVDTAMVGQYHGASGSYRSNLFVVCNAGYRVICDGLCCGNDSEIYQGVIRFLLNV